MFLKYLPPHCTEAEVAGFFSGCGEMAAGSPKLMRAPDGRVIRGFVVFATAEGCVQVRSGARLQTAECTHRPLFVDGEGGGTTLRLFPNLKVRHTS